MGPITLDTAFLYRALQTKEFLVPPLFVVKDDNGIAEIEVKLPNTQKENLEITVHETTRKLLLVGKLDTPREALDDKNGTSLGERSLGTGIYKFQVHLDESIDMYSIRALPHSEEADRYLVRLSCGSPSEHMIRPVDAPALSLINNGIKIRFCRNP